MIKTYEAFFNLQGDLIATTNRMDLEDIPMYVKKVVTKKYSQYKVNEAFELVSDDEVAYIIFVENMNEKLTLKVDDSGLSVYSKTEKVKAS